MTEQIIEISNQAFDWIQMKLLDPEILALLIASAGLLLIWHGLDWMLSR